MAAAAVISLPSKDMLRRLPRGAALSPGGCPFPSGLGHSAWAQGEGALPGLRTCLAPEPQC